jgi:hypothetical protein
MRRATRRSTFACASALLARFSVCFPEHGRQRLAHVSRALALSQVVGLSAKVVIRFSGTLAKITKPDAACKWGISGEDTMNFTYAFHRDLASYCQHWRLSTRGLLKPCESLKEKASVCNQNCAATNSDFAHFALHQIRGDVKIARAVNFHALPKVNLLAGSDHAVLDQVRNGATSG